MSDEFEFGTRAKCLDCGGEIVKELHHWSHVGASPRHPATPSPGTEYEESWPKADHKWTEIQTEEWQSTMFCLDGIGVLLTRSLHAGIWHFSVGGVRRHLPNTTSIEDAKRAVEAVVDGARKNDG